MRRFIIAAALVALTAVPALASNKTASATTNAYAAEISRPSTPSRPVSAPSKPTQPPSLPSTPGPRR